MTVNGSMMENPNTTHGRLLESTHIAGYSVERAMSELEWLLDEDRWRSVGSGYDDINAFLATLDLSGFRILADQRKKLAKRLKDIEASGRATAKLLGVAKDTIRNDLNGDNSPPAVEIINETGPQETPSGDNSPPWFSEPTAEQIAIVAQAISDAPEPKPKQNKLPPLETTPEQDRFADELETTQQFYFVLNFFYKGSKKTSEQQAKQLLALIRPNHWVESRLSPLTSECLRERLATFTALVELWEKQNVTVGKN